MCRGEGGGQSLTAHPCTHRVFQRSDKRTTCARQLTWSTPKPKGTEAIQAPPVLPLFTGIYFSAHWCPPCRAFTPNRPGIPPLPAQASTSQPIGVLRAAHLPPSCARRMRRSPWRASHLRSSSPRATRARHSSSSTTRRCRGRRCRLVRRRRRNSAAGSASRQCAYGEGGGRLAHVRVAGKGGVGGSLQSSANKIPVEGSHLIPYSSLRASSTLCPSLRELHPALL